MVARSQMLSLIGARQGWLVATWSLAALVGLVVLYAVLRSLLGLLVAGVGAVAPRRFAVALASGAIVWFTAARLDPDTGWLRWFSLPVTATYLQQLRFIHDAVTFDGTQLIGSEPLPEATLARLNGSDVFVIFVESYGATTLDDDEHAAALSAARTHLADRVTANGLQVVSARLRSPTFGGGSWRAHASLLTGVAIANDRDYELLLTGDRETLVHRFAAQGYRTVGLMPGLRQAWPEGSFYGYDRIYDAASLDYPGPLFGWWAIPDQFALARLHAREVSVEPRPPLLTVMATITSHSPFRPVPPYLADWQSLVDGAPYAADSPMQAEGYDGESSGDYVKAMEYVLATVAGYIDWASRRQDRGPVIVLIGDHQPPARVTGPGASWDVPVHVIARDPVLVDGIRGLGFVPGLVPAGEPIGAMHELTAPLLEAW